MKHHDWIQTFTGRKVFPLHLRPDDVCIEDIAHHLSNLCRFTGATRSFYCPTPDQRVLTADLRWKPAGDLRVGEELVAFDEHPKETGSCNRRRRRYRPAVVLATENVKRPVIRLEMEDGSTITASAEHPWLTSSKKSANQRWETAAEIAEAVKKGRLRMIRRFFKPWEEINSREAGWLAGMYDGEGFISFRRSGVQYGVGQNPGLVLDELRRLHAVYKFEHGESAVGTYKTQSLQVKGGWREMARLLGSIRPMRLLDKFTTGLREGLLAKQMESIVRPLRIVAAYEEGEQWVAGIETSTRTYFCEGFGSHNSVAQHSVWVSHYCAPADALWGLLHDASEAYLIDVPRPLKRTPEFEFYRRVEKEAQGAICQAFGMPLEQPESVSEADHRMLATEARDLMAPLHPDWRTLAEPYERKVIGWDPELAKGAFMKRFDQLWDAQELRPATDTDWQEWAEGRTA